MARAWKWLRDFVAPSARTERVPAPAPRFEPVLSAGPGQLSDLAADLPRSERALPYGDFGGAEEARRFADLPPIEPESLDHVDWDALARRLTRA